MAYHKQSHKYEEKYKVNPDPPVKFYLDREKKKISSELLDKIAYEKAVNMETITSSQLRRFFGEIKGLYNRLINNEDFDRILPLIKMLKSKVYYALEKGKITQRGKNESSLANFLVGGIDQINDKEDFVAFVMYFEAIVGFMYGKGKVRN